MRRDDKKGRSGRNKFPETDKRILQGQAVKEGDVENGEWRKRGGYNGEQESETEVWLMWAECVEEQRNCVHTENEFCLNGNFCVLLCC